MGEIVSKGRFAELCNVTPGRVSQWIAAGKIFGDALEGEGRTARINVEVAQGQLSRTLDVDQRHSGNGLKTRLATPAPAPASAGEPAQPALPGTGTATGPAREVEPSLEQQLLRERLEKAQRDNRAAKVDEAVANGQLCSVDDARAAAGREVQRLVARFEGSLPEFADAIAAKFKLASRDVLHELRAKWRQVRTDAAIEARERAEPLPEQVGFVVDPDSEC